MAGDVEYDALGELFRQRLENHRAEVDPDGLRKVERALSRRKRRKTVVWWYAAAASIAIAVIVGWPAESGIAPADVPVAATVPQPATALYAAENEIAPPAHIRVHEKKTAAPAVTNVAPAVANVVYVPQDFFVMDTFSLALPQEVAVASTAADTVHIALSAAETPVLDTSLVEDRPEDDGETVQKWTLAAAFGTGSNTGGMNDTYEQPMASSPTGSQGWGGRGNDYAAEMSSSIYSFKYMNRDDFADIQHSPPFTAGFTARKNLGKRGGIESGLQYTLLSSYFRWTSGADYGVHQRLHYIGVPVRLSVFLTQPEKTWRVYFAGGITVEKGIRARYLQELRSGSQTRITTVKSPISGLQWSMGAAIGINRCLSNGFSLYAEPRLEYAFDCAQPVSIRTEWPVYFGVNIGLNYEL